MTAELIKECELYIESGGVCKAMRMPSLRMMDISISEADAYLRYNRDLSFHERLFLLIDRTGKRTHFLPLPDTAYPVQTITTLP